MPAYLVTWLHLVAAVAFIGGLVFLQLVAKPVLQGLGPETQRDELLRRLGRKFRTLAWICLLTLILTGAYQLLHESGSVRIETTWGVVLMIKLFVFALAFGLMLIHDFILDPYALPAAKTGKPSSSHPGTMRATLLQQAVLVLSLCVLFIASYLTVL